MKRLLRSLLRRQLARPWSLLAPALIIALFLAAGATRVERQLDLMSLLPKSDPAVKANLEAGVGQQELIWLVAEGREDDLEAREAWAEGLLDKLLTGSGLSLNGLAAEGRLSDPVFIPSKQGVSPWPALLAAGAVPDGDAAVDRLLTETLYALAPAWLGDRLAPLQDPAEVKARLAATAKDLASLDPVRANLARLDPLNIRDLAPGGATGLGQAQAAAKRFSLKLKTGYLESKDGRFVLVPLVAGFPTTETKTTARVLAWLGRGAEGPLPPRASLKAVEAACAPNADRVFPIQVTGAHAVTAWESARLTREVLVSLGLSFVLIGLVYFIGFRTFAGYGFVMVPLLVGMICSLGLTGWTLGRLNLMAAGFGAVLLGVGDDVGILLFSRYRDERQRGRNKARALREALLGTGPGVVAGSITTAMAFLALAIAPFPGIRDLGLTTGLGLLCCLVATFLLLPPLLLRFDHGKGAFAPKAVTVEKTQPLKRWKPIAALALLGLAILGAPRTRWEEDLRKFRMADNPALALQEQLQGVLGASLRPLALEIPLGDPDRLPLRWNKLAPLLRTEGVPLPDWQTPDPRLRAVLGSDTWRQQALDIANKEGLDPVALEGPLRTLGEAARDPKVPVEALLALLPQASSQSSGAQSLTLPLRLDEAAQDRLAAKLDGSGARLVGIRPLLQVVKAIAKSSIQQAVLLSLAAVLVIIALFGRSWRFAALALAPLLASQAGVFGALGWTGEPLTFLSLTAIPIALGVSVDTAFNLLHRARHEADAAARVARVNAVCAGTTLAGFGGLAFSSYRALRGVGIACLGGVALALLLTQWLLPVMLKRWDLRSGK